MQLNKHKEALEFAVASQCLAPYDSEVAERVEDIKKRLAAGLWKYNALHSFQGLVNIFSFIAHQK